MASRVPKEFVFLLLGVHGCEEAALNVAYFELVHVEQGAVIQGYQKNGMPFGVPYKLIQADGEPTLLSQSLRMQMTHEEFRGARRPANLRR
ncbi:hypothetical protein KW783_03505 [Candidatus Parcubacteria bacterium]|nr:hypothetical protein [Candidatus Parcubacteria bacterium]